MSIKVIITGSTGMVGEGILFECLAHPSVSQVLIVNRRHYEMAHPKLQELIIPDFFDLSASTDQLSGYDACFFCAGISSVGMSEEKFTRITYDTTLHFAKDLVALNPEMVFTYVSGAHTDSSGKGRIMWARVKGKTENDLMKLPFKSVYNFRPGLMKAMPGQKNTKSFYKFFSWLYPVLHRLTPDSVSTLSDVGKAMINCVIKGHSKHILEVKDINSIARA